MRKCVNILLPLLLMGLLTSGQSVTFRSDNTKVSLNGGFSWLFQNDLREINRESRKNLPFLTQTIDDFPPTLTYGGQISIKLSERLGVGTAYQYYTTGSRIGARDYSGTYSFDQIISAHSPGIVIEYQLASQPEWAAYFELTGGAHFASWKMKEKIILGQESNSDTYHLTAFRPYLFPALKAEYPFGGIFFAGIKAGYSFDLGGKYLLTNSNSGKSEKQASFSGIRGVVSVGVLLN
jgi:hypothetical protein